MAFQNGQVFSQYDNNGVFKDAIVLPQNVSDKMAAIYLIRRELTKLEIEYMEEQPDAVKIEEMANGVFDMVTELYFRG